MSREKGNAAEERAANFLQKEGFVIVERNFYAKKMGELDIIAAKEGVLHFVEVKSGVGFDPVYNLTPAKLRKLIKSAQLYMKQKGLDVPFCLDALIIRGEEIELLENITL
jgi:putative endonuclease